MAEDDDDKIITIKSGDGTTVWLDNETSRKLALVAKSHERTKAGQIRSWVKKEYEELERLKMLPPE